MSAGYATISAFAAPREDERAEPTFEQKLEAAARSMLAAGPVEFKLSTRVGASAMAPWRFGLYRFFARDPRLPEWARSPPLPTKQRGVLESWRMILEECKTPDDQVLVMPKNWVQDADSWDLPVECRPCDPEDEVRTRILRAVFGNYAPPCPDALAQMELKLSELERRLSALERAKGTRCAPGSAV